MEFFAELKHTKQAKLISGDNQYEIRLVTDNSEILDIAKLPAETLFKVTIEPMNKEEMFKDFGKMS